MALSLGDRHSCALLDDGGVRCWGEGSFGRLGTGNQNDIGDDETPGSIDPIDLGWEAVSIAAGFEHNCATLVTNTLTTVGTNLVEGGLLVIIVLFAMLPIGVRTSEEEGEEAVPGTPESAPDSGPARKIQAIVCSTPGSSSGETASRSQLMLLSVLSLLSQL